MKTMLLTPNKFSRPQRFIETVKAIAIHWVGNADTSALFTRDYFEGLKDGPRYGSAHFCIDNDNTIYCVPVEEMAYHVGPESSATEFARAKFGGYANAFCIGLELSHPKWDGEFEEGTLWQAAILCASLCRRYGLDPLEDIIRHYDVTGKPCPKWFVAHPGEFEDFKLKVVHTMQIVEEFYV